jgi:hypothetical protein
MRRYDHSHFLALKPRAIDVSTCMFHFEALHLISLDSSEYRSALGYHMRSGMEY